MNKNDVYDFYPPAKSYRELKIELSGVIFRGAGGSNIQNIIAPEKQAVCEKDSRENGFDENSSTKNLSKVWFLRQQNEMSGII